jgi:hypothetical protein
MMNIRSPTRKLRTSTSKLTANSPLTLPIANFQVISRISIFKNLSISSSQPQSVNGRQGSGCWQHWWPLQSYIVAAALLEIDATVVRVITLAMVVDTVVEGTVVEGTVVEGTVVDAPVEALGFVAVCATFCSAFAVMSCFVGIAPMYLASGTAVFLRRVTL